MNAANARHAVAELHLDDFSAHAVDAEAPLVVHFWAPRCPPCVTFQPVFAQAASIRGDLHFASCDIDSETALARKLGVVDLPTVAIYHHGAERGRISGTMRIGAFLDWLARRGAESSRA